MKINKNKGILLRISGLPGSGKTRIAKKLLLPIRKKYGPTIPNRHYLSLLKFPVSSLLKKRHRQADVEADRQADGEADRHSAR